MHYMTGVTAETGTPVYSERPGDVSVVSNYVSSRFKFNVVMPLRFSSKTMFSPYLLSFVLQCICFIYYICIYYILSSNEGIFV
jgi:hypothetical protein